MGTARSGKYYVEPIDTIIGAGRSFLRLSRNRSNFLLNWNVL